MNYDKLEELFNTKELLNYKELCEHLNIPELAGNSKKKQLRELNGLCVFERIGQKYKVIEICDKEILDLFNNRSIYIPYIQVIISDIFEKIGKEELYLTTKELMLKTGMINNNFKILLGKDTYYNCQIISIMNGFNVEHLYNYGNKGYNEVLRPVIDSALKSMKNSKMIDYITGYKLYKEIKVDGQKIHSYKYTSINEELGKVIFKIEGESMDELGIKSSSELYGNKIHLRNNYYKLCNEKLKDYKIDYDGVFRCYLIIINKKRLYHNIKDLRIEFNELIQNKIRTSKSQAFKLLTREELETFIKATIVVGDNNNEYNFYNDLYPENLNEGAPTIL